MKKIIFILFIAHYSLQIAETFSYQSVGFNIDISLYKTDYLSLEPIWVTVKIKNNGNHKDSLENLYSQELVQRLIIKNSAGNILPYHDILVSYAFSVHTKFEPGEELIFDLELNNGYGNKKIENPIAATMYSFFSEGNYEVYSYYNTKNGIVKSNLANFNISNPLGTEKEVFEKLIQTYQKNGFKIPDYGKKAEEFKTIYEKYPMSVFVDQAFHYFIDLTSAYDYNLDNKIIDMCYLFFSKQPDSFYAYQILRNCGAILEKVYGKDKTIFREFLENLGRMYPETKVGKSVKEILKHEI